MVRSTFFSVYARTAVSVTHAMEEGLKQQWFYSIIASSFGLGMNLQVVLQRMVLCYHKLRSRDPSLELQRVYFASLHRNSLLSAV